MMTSTKSWHDAISQQFRSDEISKIATELAKLEPHATMLSKMRLASTFENKCFEEAESLDEYRKKIDKQLKKVKKNYEKKGVDTSTLNEEQILAEVSKKKFHLRTLYGDTLTLISDNAKNLDLSVPKLQILIPHINRTNGYAAEIAAITPEKAVMFDEVGQTWKPIVLTIRSPKDTLEHLNDIEKFFNDRISQLREWVCIYSADEK